MCVFLVGSLFNRNFLEFKNLEGFKQADHTHIKCSACGTLSRLPAQIKIKKCCSKLKTQ